MILFICLLCFVGALGAPTTGFGIIGGHNATKGEFPYIISLRFCNTSSEVCFHECGGSIINDRWIVTAAHCTEIYYGFVFKVAAGMTNLNDPAKQQVGVETVIVHPKYDFSRFLSENDIALIKLSSPLTFNELVQPIALPEPDEEVSVGDAILAGWGAITYINSSYEIYPDDLQTATFPVLDFKVCATIIAQEDHSAPTYNNSIICTGPMSGGLGMCHEDSGGPLARDGKLIGLSSWITMPCAMFGSINIFTKASIYVTWINDVINRNN